MGKEKNVSTLAGTTLSNRPHGSNSRHGATDSEKLIKNMDQINVMELGRW